MKSLVIGLTLPWLGRELGLCLYWRISKAKAEERYTQAVQLSFSLELEEKDGNLKKVIIILINIG